MCGAACWWKCECECEYEVRAEFEGRAPYDVSSIVEKLIEWLINCFK
jgi:hypothetical protein